MVSSDGRPELRRRASAPPACTSSAACPRAASCRRYRRRRRRSRSEHRIESQTHGLPERLLAWHVVADERFVHDGNKAAARAVGGGEVPAAAQRRAHRPEPAWCRGVQPERGPAGGPQAHHRPIADADDPGRPATAGEETCRGDGCRSHAGDRRRGVAQTLDAGAALLGRPAARLEVQLRDEQWLRLEAEGQPVERRERAKEQSGGDDQDE